MPRFRELGTRLLPGETVRVPPSVLVCPECGGPLLVSATASSKTPQISCYLAGINPDGDDHDYYPDDWDYIIELLVDLTEVLPEPCPIAPDSVTHAPHTARSTGERGE